MREYFHKLLSSLDKLTGLQQMNKLLMMPEAKKEINELLDILCRVSKQFGHIPEADQQRIISEKIITDSELTSLNAKILFKWLSGVSAGYIKHEAEAVPVGYKPLTGQDREKWIQEWGKSLKSFESSVKPDCGAGTRMKSTLEELPKIEGYKKPSLEDLQRSELHTQWIRENFDPITANPKANFITEEEFLKKQK